MSITVTADLVSLARREALEEALDAIDGVVLSGTDAELRSMMKALGHAQDAVRNLLPADEP